MLVSIAINYLGFLDSKIDTSLFIFKGRYDPLLVMVYVEDILVTRSNPISSTWLINQLHVEFAIKDFRPLHFFLRVEVKYTEVGLYLTQKRYIHHYLLQKANMNLAKPIVTPIISTTSSSQFFGDSFFNPTQYRSISQMLQYSTSLLSRPIYPQPISYLITISQMHNCTNVRTIFLGPNLIS